MHRDAPANGRTAELTRFIDALVAEIEPLVLAHNRSVWDANVTGEAHHEAESARLDAVLRQVFARRDAYALLTRLRDAGGVPDPQLQRQLVLLHAQHRAQQIPAETIARTVALEKRLESRFNNFRADLDGERVTDNALREVLRRSDDPARRRRAWEASKQIGSEVVGELLELVALRNEAARQLGFDNYYTMMLTLDELDEGELFELLDGIAGGTAAPFEAYRRELDLRLAGRFGIAPADVRPWHLGDPFFQEAPVHGVDLDPCFAGRPLEEVAAGFFAAIGLDISELLARADLHERPGKCQHAFCLSVDRGADVRVLCNLQPDEYWMSTLLHEFGHAVYDVRIDRTLPFVLRNPAHTLTTEATAMLFGRLTRSAAWLTRWAGMPREAAAATAEAARRAGRDQLLVQARWMLVMCHMERALYRDPRQDLNRLWWDLVERFQRVPRPEGRDAPDWAAKTHFSVAPVYYQNYLLGEIMASQLQRTLLEDVLGGGAGVWERYVTSPEVGRHLEQRLFRRGCAMDWREASRSAAGGPLRPQDFVDELAGRA